MVRSVAVLRGINVGGNRTIRMAGLRAIFAAAGCTDAETYIQSGNVVFSHTALAGAALEDVLETQVRHETGFDVAVLVRTAHELTALVADNPYPGTDGTRLVVSFLREAVEPGLLAAVDRDAVAPEAFTLRGRELYLYLPNGQARAKLPEAITRCRLPVAATARNWNTVVKLTELASR